MTSLKSLLLAPLALAVNILPVLAVSSPAPAVAPAIPQKSCLAPTAFITALNSAGDWVMMRSPDKADDATLRGIVFREAGMVNVAVFKDGCLAIVMVVGKAPPDIQA